MEVSGQLHVSATLLPRRLGVSQSRSGACEEETTLFPLLGDASKLYCNTAKKQNKTDANVVWKNTFFRFLSPQLMFLEAMAYRWVWNLGNYCGTRGENALADRKKGQYFWISDGIKNG
jgi:hypothetical protein